MRARIAWVPVAAMLLSRPAAADPKGEARPAPPARAAAKPGPRPPRIERRPLAVLSALLLPGRLVHGSGHLVGGQPKGAARLAAMQALGMGGIGLGITGLAASGASRRFVSPLAATTFGGVGLFVISALSDLYGVAAPEGERGAPRLVPPSVTVRLGGVYVENPALSYGALALSSLDLRTGPLRLEASAWVGMGASYERLRLVGAYRFVGPRPGERAARDGSYVDLEAGLSRDRYGEERFVDWAPEVAVRGRLDLARISPTLLGSFAEMWVGRAFQVTDYAEARAGTDSAWVLLGGFAYGVYLGTPERPAEVALYYDHRHDDFAAGLKLPGLGSGVAGHVGARGSFLLAGPVGGFFDVAGGSAVVATLGAFFEFGKGAARLPAAARGAGELARAGRNP